MNIYNKELRVYLIGRQYKEMIKSLLFWLYMYIYMFMTPGPPYEVCTLLWVAVKNKFERQRLKKTKTATIAFSTYVSAQLVVGRSLGHR